MWGFVVCGYGGVDEWRVVWSLCIVDGVFVVVYGYGLWDGVV